jgi:class 3 adenylate cyclase
MESPVQYVVTGDDVRIAYTSIGEGDPVVFAANIWGDIELVQQTGRIYGGLVQSLLRNDFRVILYDSRGCGASERDVADISQTARLADLEAVVDQLRLEPFALFSVVHGCTTGIGYAASHPERVTHLILEAPYTRGADYYARAPALRAIKALTDMAEDNWEFFTLTVTNWLMNFKNAEAATELAAIYRKTMDPSDYMRMISGFEQSDITGLLSLVRAPTMVIHDATSPFSLFSQFAFVREVVAGIEGAQLTSVQNRDEMANAIVRFVRGDKGTIEASAPNELRPVRTVLFTDLVGHTEMMSRMGDERGREVLREHERITRNVLKQFGGTEVKTMGDGFMASFGSVSKAVECAIAIQRAFTQREGEPLKVRVGLNAGEPIEEDGDLFGATVILASRIAAKAEGGEILVSDNVRSLSAGKRFLFADRGEFVAKGFEEPVRVYEVSWRE